LAPLAFVTGSRPAPRRTAWTMAAVVVLPFVPDTITTPWSSHEARRDT
jgi:hypothetical protein